MFKKKKKTFHEITLHLNPFLKKEIRRPLNNFPELWRHQFLIEMWEIEYNVMTLLTSIFCEPSLEVRPVSLSEVRPAQWT